MKSKASFLLSLIEKHYKSVQVQQVILMPISGVICLYGDFKGKEMYIAKRLLDIYPEWDKVEFIGMGSDVQNIYTRPTLEWLGFNMKQNKKKL